MNILHPVISRKLSHVCNLKPYKDTKWLMPNGNPTGVVIYNCVALQKVPIILNDPHIATWYSCGPTVYDSAHIGHASCYVKLDIIQRILKSFFNIKLVTAMGITDIDDKIIKKAAEKKTEFNQIAKQYEHEFWNDMLQLNVMKPLIVCRVSDHISAIQSFIKKIVENEMAYAVKGGSVYFDTNKYSDYGKLHKIQDPYEELSLLKKNQMDFALWKGHKPNEPAWEAPWGSGRPGWHIECSAMVSKLFGSQLDFHAGGIDLKFPHHENEEAQSCAYHNKRQWVNYWVHVGHLHLKDVKMSKSLQNTITIQKFLESHSADVFRMMCLMSKYRSPIEYSENVLETAENTLNKFKYFLKEAYVYVNNNETENGDYKSKLLDNLQKVEETNLECLKTDFDTASCINNLLNLISDTNKIMKLGTKDYYPVPISLIADYISTFLNKLGLKLEEISSQNMNNGIIDTLVEFRHTTRINALGRKDQELLNACDVVRYKLKSAKIEISDRSKTPSWVFTK